MFKYSAIVLALIGMLFVSESALAAMMMCTDKEMQAWGKAYGYGYTLACEVDSSGNWSVDVNLDNPSPSAINEARLDICLTAGNRCTATHGTDLKSCLIARDNHCGYYPCQREWQPHCNSSNNCLSAYTYCNKYLSPTCTSAGSTCASGTFSTGPGYCQQYYNCGVRSCAETWKPLCDNTNNCYISYKYCGQYLSDDCITAAWECLLGKQAMSCGMLYLICGYPQPLG